MSALAQGVLLHPYAVQRLMARYVQPIAVQYSYG